ncbi:hypothetical protein [Methylobacterium oxalidis]|uniref:hypothetical protein n=1 Tax=Methylobacterium oxalidis TaxID=944322 RepID=UPI00331575DC
MMDFFKQFDTYSLKARVFPALIAGLPTLALLFMLVPWDRIGPPHLTASAMGLVLLFAFADVARRTGRHVETKLGTRSAPEQWHRGNADVAEGAKDRYRAFIADKLKLPAPTAEDERTDSARANDFYRSAGNWLRENTRDTRTHAILFGENITYGFRRNLLGLKPISLLVNILVLAFCVVLLWFRPLYFAALPNIDEKLVMIIAAVFLHSAYMLFAVNKSAVRDASRAYGTQLVLSCETLMRQPTATTPQARRKRNNNG